MEEKDLNTLVAAAMEKPAVSEEQAAKAPAEEAETEESFQYQYPSIELFERAPDEGDPGAEDELKANAQKLVDTLESFGVRTRVLDISRGRRSHGMRCSRWRASRSAASPRWRTTSP